MVTLVYRKLNEVVNIEIRWNFMIYHNEQFVVALSHIFHC